MRKIKTRLKRLLLWSQKYTKADMHYIAKNGSWVIFNQVINGFLSLGLTVAFANMLPKETFGLYRYILSIGAILNIFTLTGMNSAVARATAQGDDGVLKPAVSYQIKWNLLMFTASLALGAYYLFKDNVTLAVSLFILGCFTPLTLAFNTYGAYLEGKRKLGLANILSIASIFTYSSGIFIALFFTDNVIWLICIYALTTFIPSFIFYAYIIHSSPLPTSVSIEETKRYGRELTYLRFIDPIVSQIDKILLGNLWGVGQLATYTLVTAIPNRVGLFLKNWVAIGFPKFSTKNSSELNDIFYFRIMQGMFLGLTIAIMYILTAPFIFKYLLPQYLDGLMYSQLIAVSFIFAIPNRYTTLLFTSQGWSKVLFKRTLVQSIVQILLYIICGVWGGLFGLVIANILNASIGMLLNISMWQKMNTK